MFFEVKKLNLNLRIFYILFMSYQSALLPQPTPALLASFFVLSKRQKKAKKRLIAMASSFITSPPVLLPPCRLHSTHIQLSPRSFVTPVPVHLHAPQPATPRICPVTAPRAQYDLQPPDYDNGFDPATDPAYFEVLPFTIKQVRDSCVVLTLRSVASACSHPATTTTASGAEAAEGTRRDADGDMAFKMSVTNGQVDALRRAIQPARASHPEVGGRAHDDDDDDDDDATAKGASERRAYGRTRRTVEGRPSTHDLVKSVVDASGAVVVHAAITHMRDGVFIARVWLRVGDNMVHVDARPSDVAVLCMRMRAPLFLRRALLGRWGIPVARLMEDARHGRCQCVVPSMWAMSTRSLQVRLSRPLFVRLAVLKMRLDVAVRAQRFREACAMRDEIAAVCPVDHLQHLLAEAVSEERFLDARDLDDKLTVWKARLRMWEKGAIDLEDASERERLGSDRIE